VNAELHLPAAGKFAPRLADGVEVLAVEEGSGRRW